MKFSHHTIIVISAGLLGTSVLIAGEQPSSGASKTAQSEKSQSQSGQKILASQLPQRVQKAMQSEAPGANLENVQKLNKNGQTCYQASFDKDGLKGRMTVGEDGSILQYEESANMALFEAAPDLSVRGKSKLQLSQLPQPVQDAVKQRAGTNQLGDIFKTTESQSGKTAYHVSYNDGAALTDLLLDEKGDVLYRADETALFSAPLQDSQALTFQSIPETIRDSITERGGSAQTVTDIDKGTWKGQTVYKVMLHKDGSYRPLLLSENGQAVNLSASNSSSSGAAPQSQKGSSQNASRGASEKNSNSSDSNHKH
jgi:hypothetical protein